MEPTGSDVPWKRMMTGANATVAILGYGRFGRALASLLVDAGAVVRAYDPRSSIPVALVASSPESLVRGATHVVLAVPIAAMRAAIEEIAPFLDPSQIVLDVGSVKTGPIEILAEVLGHRIPWVGTHPLFGPTSLALAERPLRVVVCPNAMHPDAAQRARALYESIGCEILEETAELHDRRMAETHALAFFVAKGVLEANMGLDVPNAPPSFQAITRTVDVVRSDAGHLFAAIQCENPYAAEARRKFIDSLIAIDARLSEQPQGDVVNGQSAMDLAITNVPATAPDLRETRELIDDLDRELIMLLARRMELARRARRAKARLGLGIVDSVREVELLGNRRVWAAAEGMDPEGVAEIFEAILRASRRAQVHDT
jgi:prephenate dehydrogenase